MELKFEHLTGCFFYAYKYGVDFLYFPDFDGNNHNWILINTVRGKRWNLKI